jgi:hypothetical protein
MARYFLHVWTGNDCARDAEGIDVDTDHAAHICAINSAREILEDDVRKGLVEASHRIELVDDTGRAVASMPFELRISGLPANTEM